MTNEIDGDDFFSGGFRLAASQAIDRLGEALEKGDKELASKLAQEALQLEGKRRMLENPNLHMEFTPDGKVLGLFKNNESGAFGFKNRCAVLGLEPEQTSMHALECMENGLDPEKTSMHALECKKLGLDHDKTSINDLTRAGSSLYSHIDLRFRR